MDREDLDNNGIDLGLAERVVRIRNERQRRTALPFLEHVRATENRWVLVFVGLVDFLILRINRLIDVHRNHVEVRHTREILRVGAWLVGGQLDGQVIDLFHLRHQTADYLTLLVVVRLVQRHVIGKLHVVGVQGLTVAPLQARLELDERSETILADVAIGNRRDFRDEDGDGLQLVVVVPQVSLYQIHGPRRKSHLRQVTVKAVWLLRECDGQRVAGSAGGFAHRADEQREEHRCDDDERGDQSETSFNLHKLFSWAAGLSC